MPVLDEVLEQLEADPAARFVADGQTILLDDYLAVKPWNEGRVRAQVERGGLEIGPWYVLSDLLIPSAASLRRNLAEGAHDAARFGKRLEVLYSPDGFGHPAWLPSLAVQMGIRRAVVRRGLGRPEGVDRDLYRWEAADGSALLVYHLPAGGYDLAIELAHDGRQLERVWKPIRRELVKRAVSREVAVFLGADHHAMVRDVAGLRTRLQALEKEHVVRVSGLTEYFDAVERAQPAPPVIRGELRRLDGHTWVLQGVHSTRSRMKRKHAAAELFLSRIAEPLARRAAESRGRDRQPLLRAAWRLLLESQFHDTLAGSTSDLVQREQDVRLESVLGIAGEIAAGGFRELAGYDPDQARAHAGREPERLVLWNPAAVPRHATATAEVTFFRGDIPVGPPGTSKPRRGNGYHPFALRAEDGQIVPVQVLGVRRGQERRDFERHYPDQDEVDRVWVAFRSPPIPPHQLATLVSVPLPRPDSGAELAASTGGRQVVVKAGVLENEWLHVAVGKTGALAITDRKTGNQYAGVGALIDEPDRGDLYTMSRGKGALVGAGAPAAQAFLARGPLIGAIETRWTMASAGRGRLRVRQVVALRADSSLLHIRLDVDNQAIDHRLRVRVPIGAGEESVAGAAIGVERRAPVAPDTRPGLIERPVATAPAQRFVHAGLGARGLSVLSPGFFEYEWTAGRELLITLLRSIGELAREGLPERPGRAGWPEATPDAQELGAHTVHLGIRVGSVGADSAEDELQSAWEELFLPTQALWIREP